LTPIDPLPLACSWPLFESGLRFDLGGLCEDEGKVAGALLLNEQALVARGIGLWECDLADNSLTWSPAVYDLFGLPRGVAVMRADAVALYCERSRALMERLRAYAIRHRRGFTLDTEILPALGGRRWVRLIAAPMCEGGRVVRLRGLKRDVSHEYR